jgi:hypothetical protein
MARSSPNFWLTQLAFGRGKICAEKASLNTERPYRT